MQREMILFRQVLDKISVFSRPLDKDTVESVLFREKLQSSSSYGGIFLV